MAMAENVIGPVNLAVILNLPLRFEIRADNRRFSLSPLSRNRFCVTGPLTQSRSFFSTTLFLSGPDSGLVSVRQARYQLLWLVSISADSPRDQRGRSCSRNRRRGFGIGADNGRFRISEVSLNCSCVARLLTHTPLFPEKIFCLAV